MIQKEKELLKRITVKPGLMRRKPTIRSMRFTVSDILEMLASGMKEDEILKQHPILEIEDIHAALLYASLRLSNTVLLNA